MGRLLVRAFLVVMAAILTVTIVTSVTRAQQGNSDKASLVDGNTTDCFGNAPVAGATFGFVNAHRVDDELIINVHVRNGLPNTTYIIGVRCVNNDATLQTNSKGVGNATYSRPAQMVATDCGGNPGACGYPGGEGTPITQFAVSVHTGVDIGKPLGHFASRTLNP